MEALTKDIIIGLSGFAAGLAIYLAWTNIRGGMRGVPYAWSFAIARLGLAGVVLLVAEAVFGAPGVPLTWRSALYALCLAGVFVGLFGIGHKERGETKTRNVGGVAAIGFVVLLLVMVGALAEAASSAERRRLEREVTELEESQARLEVDHARFRDWVAEELGPWVEDRVEEPGPEPSDEPLPSPPAEVPTPSETPAPSPSPSSEPSPSAICVPLIDLCLE